MTIGAGKALNIDEILTKALEETTLNRQEILLLLSLRDEADTVKLFAAAKAIRDRNFDKKIFMYGFVYFSTHCRNNCAFCLYRKSNNEYERYRKTEEEVLETAINLKEAGVHLLDFTMGEDPHFFDGQYAGFGELYDMVKRVKKVTGMPVMISPGLVPEKVLAEFKKAGADWYACYQETHNKELYSKLRLGQSYEQRMNSKLIAHRQGLLIEEGLLTGVGDTDEDVADSLLAMQELQADQVRVMSFVPQKDTPMVNWQPVSRLREMVIIAVMRVVFPDRLIPASLDVDGLEGLRQRLDAGANVVTSIIPPHSGLAGVSQSILDIDDGHRTVASVEQVLHQAGLTAATREEYTSWLAKRVGQRGLTAGR